MCYVNGVKCEDFHRMKHVATAISEVSLDTGYDYDFLCDCINELEKDGLDLFAAINEVFQIAYEGDL